MSQNIQFGSGGNILSGWINHDMDCDLTKPPFPYADNSVNMVFAEHCLEHTTVAQAVAALDEFYRILKPGGRLRVCCPVLERLTPEAARDIALNHGHLIIFSEQSLKDLIRISGFKQITVTERKAIDGHHNVIGKEKDDRETCRVEAFKP